TKVKIEEISVVFFAGPDDAVHAGDLMKAFLYLLNFCQMSVPQVFRTLAGQNIEGDVGGGGAPFCGGGNQERAVRKDGGEYNVSGFLGWIRLFPLAEVNARETLAILRCVFDAVDPVDVKAIPKSVENRRVKTERQQLILDGLKDVAHGLRNRFLAATQLSNGFDI